MAERRGFTLVEAMVAMAVVAAVASIGMVYLLAELPTYRVNGAARLILSDLRLAKTMAVEYGDDVYLSFDVAQQQYQVVRDTNQNDVCDPGAGDTVLKTVRLPDSHAGVEFYAHGGVVGGEVTFGGDVARLTPQGTSNGGAVYLRPAADAGVRTDRQRQLTVTSTTARAIARRWGGSGWV